MKMLYLTALDTCEKEKCGILGKIQGQINSFQENGMDVYFAHFYSSHMLQIELGGQVVCSIGTTGNTTRQRMSGIYQKLFEYMQENTISCIYIRFMSLDAHSIRFYDQLKKQNCLILMEFYSHNLELEAWKTVKRNLTSLNLWSAAKGALSLVINRRFFKKLNHYVDRIITTTEIGTLYRIPTINVVNGISAATSQVRSKQSSEYDFNIVSVAMISPWHGYDRIIRGIGDYYSHGGRANIMYTVIGDGEEKPRLEKLVTELNLQDHVVFTGVLLGEELNTYYDRADIALEMLAGFRRTSGKISSIKMAEYFAKGIPVVYASDSDLGNDELEKYCFRVENNDSPIHIQNVIDFASNLYSNEVDVSNSMNCLAKKYFDWNVTMGNLHKYIAEWEKSKLMTHGNNICQSSKEK